jgi:hypothetical protein
VDHDPHPLLEVRLGEPGDDADQARHRRAQAHVDDPLRHRSVEPRQPGAAVVEQQREFVAGDVVASAREQDRPRLGAARAHLLEQARQLVDLGRFVRHVLERVALVGHRLDLEAARLEAAEDVAERVVEPGVALGDQQPEPRLCRGPGARRAAPPQHLAGERGRRLERAPRQCSRAGGPGRRRGSPFLQCRLQGARRPSASAVGAAEAISGWCSTRSTKPAGA